MTPAWRASSSLGVSVEECQSRWRIVQFSLCIARCGDPMYRAVDSYFYPHCSIPSTRPFACTGPWPALCAPPRHTGTRRALEQSQSLASVASCASLASLGQMHIVHD
jgi:hypothetical protein